MLSAIFEIKDFLVLSSEHGNICEKYASIGCRV